jgi:hypothetical protein
MDIVVLIAAEGILLKTNAAAGAAAPCAQQKSHFPYWCLHWESQMVLLLLLQLLVKKKEEEEDATAPAGIGFHGFRQRVRQSPHQAAAVPVIPR